MTITSKTSITFHNVGQGLFSSVRTGRLNLVYDCGSAIGGSKTRKSDFHKVIGRYASSLARESKLHILILSHIHEDHANGLNSLLSQVKVDTVILPYIPLLERLMMIAAYQGNESWFFDFLRDPVLWLLESGVRSVILFGNSDNQNSSRKSEGGQESGPSPSQFDELESIIQQFKDDLDDDDNLMDRFTETEPLYKTYGRGMEERVYFKKTTSGLPLAGIAELGFFVKSIASNLQDDFNGCVRRILRKFPSRSMGWAKMEYIIDSPQGRRKLRECYKKIAHNLNETSLCLYYRPIKTVSGPQGSGRSSDISTLWRDYSSAANAYLLTGDAPLGDNSFLCEMVEYFQKNLNTMAVLQVPHHGSCYSWNPILLKYLQGLTAAVISAGISNKYGHPANSVLSDIISANILALRCDESNSITLL